MLSSDLRTPRRETHVHPCPPLVGFRAAGTVVSGNHGS